MARKIALTPASVDALQKGLLADLLTPGLTVEALGSGKKRWRYRRQLAGQAVVVTIKGELFPAQSIADARVWARGLNEQVEAGIDPREALREEQLRNAMTVTCAHEYYMDAVREGRASRAKRPNKPRTIRDKLKIYKLDIAPKLAKRSIYEVTEADLIRIVEAKGRVAKIRANRLAAELKVFFGWAASLRGMVIGLEVDPSRRLGDLRFPEHHGSRKLSLQEIEWFLKALLPEPRWVQRGMLLLLLTAARISELAQARSAETVSGVWTIPGGRVKNSADHRIQLGPWGRALIQSEHEWLFPAPRIDGPRNNSVWYKARDRIRGRMSKLSGREIEPFTPHDFRRTARSNTKRLKVDFETAEAMLNHLRSGMERIYDGYELEEEKAAWFLKWEEEVAGLARRAGVAIALGVPGADLASLTIRYRVSLPLPQPIYSPVIEWGAAICSFKADVRPRCRAHIPIVAGADP
jgi:integrase